MTTPTAPQSAETPEAKPPAKPFLRPMEKAMLGMTVFYLVGVVIFGNVTPGPIRGYTMTAYCFAFVWFFLKPFGLVDKLRGSR